MDQTLKDSIIWVVVEDPNSIKTLRFSTLRIFLRISSTEETPFKIFSMIMKCPLVNSAISLEEYLIKQAKKVE